MNSRKETTPMVQMQAGQKEFGVPTGTLVQRQTSAMEALHERKSDVFVSLIDESIEVDKEYPSEDDKTFLHLAVEKGDVKAVQKLLLSKANPDHAHLRTWHTSLHVAVLHNSGEEVFKILLGNGADPNAVTFTGETVLHLLVRKCVEAKVGMGCLKLVLGQEKVQVNKRNHQGGKTPLAVVAVTEGPGQFEVLKTLIESGADWSLPQIEGGSKTIRDIIEKRLPEIELVELREKAEATIATKRSSVVAARDSLMTLIYNARISDNISEFKDALDQVSQKALESDDLPPGELSLIQNASQLGLHDHVRALLARASGQTAPAVILAARSGHYKVIYVMKKHKMENERDASVVTTSFAAVHQSTKSSVLHMVLRRPLKDGKSPTLENGERKRNESFLVKYAKCIDLLLDRQKVSALMEKEFRIIINAKDKRGNTALHYATQLWPQTAVMGLLERGANIGFRNSYGEVPMENILPDTMEAFLNEFCLRSEEDPTNKEFCVTVHYDFLAPPQELDGLTGPGKEDASNAKVTVACNDYVDRDLTKMWRPLKERRRRRQPLPETEVLWLMSQSKKHRHLLKHPVISSFLWLKWNRIIIFYHLNLFFYFWFASLLTLYIFTIYGGRSLTANGILSESCYDSNNSVTEGDTKKKENDTVKERPMDMSSVATFNIDVYWYTCTVSLSLLALREFIQFAVARTRYICSIENWFEILLIALTSLLLFLGGYGCYVDLKRQIAATVIVLSWSGLVTMVGRHPRLTNFNIYITMFYKVLTTFLTFLAWYFMFIFSFALGFYILLHRDDDHVKKPDEYRFFNNLGTSVVKTFTMFVGELEFSVLPIETPYAYTFFLIYVFFIVVVMMNLLNGLAVSEIAAIRSEAEINFYACQVEVISYVEAMLLGDPFNFLSSWPSFVRMKRRSRCGLGDALYKIPPVRFLLTRASWVLLFYDDLPRKRVHFYPNKESDFYESIFGVGGGKRGNEEVVFPRTIMEAAKAVILEKTRSKNSLEERVNALVRDREELNSKLDRILNMLDSVLAQTGRATSSESPGVPSLLT